MKPDSCLHHIFHNTPVVMKERSKNLNLRLLLVPKTNLIKNNMEMQTKKLPRLKCWGFIIYYIRNIFGKLNISYKLE